MKIKYKHIEGAREIRLWITNVILPAAGLITFLQLKTDCPRQFWSKCKNNSLSLKNKIRRMFVKK